MEDVFLVAGLAGDERRAEELFEQLAGMGTSPPVLFRLKERAEELRAIPAFDASDFDGFTLWAEKRAEFAAVLAEVRRALSAAGEAGGAGPVVAEQAPGVYALTSRPGFGALYDTADPVAVAAAAFAEALRTQPGMAALDADSAAALGRRAADAVASGLEWYEHVGEVVDVYGAQAILGVGSRQAVYDLVKRNRLLGLRRSGGAMAVPLFQLDPATGRPYRVVPDVLTTFTDAAVDAYTVASWFNTPQLELSGDTPATALRDPARAEAIRRCAAAAAERWSH